MGIFRKLLTGFMDFVLLFSNEKLFGFLPFSDQRTFLSNMILIYLQVPGSEEKNYVSCTIAFPCNAWDWDKLDCCYDADDDDKHNNNKNVTQKSTGEKDRQNSVTEMIELFRVR